MVDRPRNPMRSSPDVETKIVGTTRKTTTVRGHSIKSRLRQFHEQYSPNSPVPSAEELLTHFREATAQAEQAHESGNKRGDRKGR